MVKSLNSAPRDTVCYRLGINGEVDTPSLHSYDGACPFRCACRMPGNYMFQSKFCYLPYNIVASSVEFWKYGGGGGGVCVGSGDELLLMFLQILVALVHASMFWDHTFVNVPLEDWEVAASTLTLAAMEHVAMQARTASIV